MFGDKPDRFCCGHPVETIESRQVYRTRVSPQGAFAAQIEIDVKITHGQLTQGAIYRLAIPAAGKIRFRYRAPVPARFENRNDMVCVPFCFQIEDQWWESENAERSRRENSAFETGSGVIAQDFLWRSRGEAQVIRQIVEKLLNASRRFQSAQLAQLG